MHPIQHRHVATSASTNSELLTAVHTQAINIELPYLLTADQQSAGRGQYHRDWQSPVGNVYLSLYYPLSGPISGLLSLMVGYYLVQAPFIQAINHNNKMKNLPVIGVKWPNDIGFYQHGDFNKLAGILIEPAIIKHKTVGVVIGVGINLTHAPKLATASEHSLLDNRQSQNNIRPIALHELTTTRFNANDLYPTIQGALVQAVQHFMASTGSVSTSHHHSSTKRSFVDAYAKVNILSGKLITIIQPMASKLDESSHGEGELTNVPSKQQQLCGKALGINPDGSLRLHLTDASIKDIYTGSIRLLDQ